MPQVLVLDYPLARTRRLMGALASIGIDARLTDTPLSARQADVLVVPDGDDDDRALSRGISGGVVDVIAGHVAKERPTLAVGLGLCLLLSGRTHPAMPAGADIFRAPVQHFDPRMADEGERPLLSPHVGTSFVVGLDRHPVLSGVIAGVMKKGDAGVWLHFRHRLCAPARIPQADVAVGHHGVPFAAAIWRGPLLATQFLPEQSGPLGIEMLRAFFAKASLSSTRPGLASASTSTQTPKGAS